MSSKNNVFHYYVEGECEEKLINTYKKPPCILILFLVR